MPQPPSSTLFPYTTLFRSLLALMWYYAGDGKGGKDMIILPYKDQLALFTKYLQQLVMESLGKEQNLAGEVVHQGIAVYGNKGDRKSTRLNSSHPSISYAVF